MNLYVFDKQLRLLTMDALERIEAAIRVDLSHTLGKLDAFASSTTTGHNKKRTPGSVSAGAVQLRGAVLPKKYLSTGRLVNVSARTLRRNPRHASAYKRRRCCVSCRDRSVGAVHLGGRFRQIPKLNKERTYAAMDG